MRRSGLDTAWVIASALALACVLNPGHRCEDDTQCLLAAHGRCEAEGACSYPDPQCPSGYRYGKWAPGDLADACVPAGASSSTDASSDTTTSEDAPARIHRCGDGTMDADEACDGGGSSVCNPRRCVVPGTIVWEQIYDGPGDGSDRGHTLAVDAGGASFYIGGMTVTDPTRGTDVVVQRRAVATGELEWTWTESHSELADEARDLAVTADGSLVVIGTVVDAGDDLWMAKFEPDELDATEPEPTWELVHDHAGGEDRGQGVAVMPDGTLVGVGWAAADDEDALFVRVGDDGELRAARAVDLSNGAGTDHLLDVVAAGDDVIVTGYRRDGAADAYNVVTARYDPDFAEVTAAMLDPPNSGNANRGIRIATAMDGAIAVAGSLTDNRCVWRHADSATLAFIGTQQWGDAELHDEATDIAFHDDGSYVVVGIVDFRNGGTPDDESDDDSTWWVAMHEPNGDARWATSDAGFVDPPGADRALAVVVVDELAIVTGYLVTDVDTGGKAIWTVAYAL